MTDPTRFDLAAGMDLAGVDVGEIWLRYASLGGRAAIPLLARRIAGTAGCSDYEHDLIAQVLNEVFIDLGLDTFPVGYHRRLPRDRHEAFSESESVRKRAVEARRRSAEAARRAAELHLIAARLMRASGQTRLAGRANSRAFAAFIRSRRLSSASC